MDIKKVGKGVVKGATKGVTKGVTKVGKGAVKGMLRCVLCLGLSVNVFWLLRACFSYTPLPTFQLNRYHNNHKGCNEGS